MIEYLLMKRRKWGRFARSQAAIETENLIKEAEYLPWILEARGQSRDELLGLVWYRSRIEVLSEFNRCWIIPQTQFVYQLYYKAERRRIDSGNRAMCKGPTNAQTSRPDVGNVVILAAGALANIDFLGMIAWGTAQRRQRTKGRRLIKYNCLATRMHWPRYGLGWEER